MSFSTGNHAEMIANTEQGLLATYEALTAYAGNSSPPDVSELIVQFPIWTTQVNAPTPRPLLSIPCLVADRSVWGPAFDVPDFGMGGDRTSSHRKPRVKRL